MAASDQGTAMSENVILKFAETLTLERGGGVANTPLVVAPIRPDAAFTTGISSFPVNHSASLHKHNCDEQVTLLSGRTEAEIDGETTELRTYDMNYVTDGVEYCFRNMVDEPMVILWIYGSNKVTCTFTGSDEEIPHVSEADMLVR
tara:strand:- start:876 stop:1313 length:438 start_codon:yes stop_codon:yes gene_type:complete